MPSDRSEDGNDRYHCSNCGTALPEILVDGPVAGGESDTPAVEICGSCSAEAIVADGPDCPVCENTIGEYESRQSVDGLCPHCGTKVRHRIEREGDRSETEQTKLVTDGGVQELSKQDVKQQLDLSCTLVVNTTPGAHLEGMMACILSYRDFIKSNIRQAGGVSGPKFVSWMESATRDPADFPEPWGAKLIRMFDEALIDAVREENLPPAVVVEALDEWAEDSKRDVTVAHDVPEGFFDA